MIIYYSGGSDHDSAIYMSKRSVNIMLTYQKMSSDRTHTCQLAQILKERKSKVDYSALLPKKKRKQDETKS